MSTTTRVRHGKEDEDVAYRLQVIGAKEGAIKGTLIAGTIVALLNYRFPLVRRQTLAGKAFLTMWGTIFGMVTQSDKYLLQYELEHRIVSEAWRSRARAELAASGTVPSETTMRAWKRKHDAEKLSNQIDLNPKIVSSTPLSTSTTTTTIPSSSIANNINTNEEFIPELVIGNSVVLKELEKVHARES